jgi:hypothetical protein
VFCDDCNTPYHQLCHVPNIDRIVVSLADAQWFCKECLPKRREMPLETGLTGEGLSMDVKKTYLSSLSKAQLIELIQYAETLDSKMPLYSPQTHTIVLKMQLENNKRPFPSASHNGQVDFEDLLVDAMTANSGGQGVQLSQIWKWIARDTNSPNMVDSTFKQSATRALQRALRRGRIIKTGDLYHVNTAYVSRAKIEGDQTWSAHKLLTSNHPRNYHYHNISLQATKRCSVIFPCKFLPRPKKINTIA